MSTLRGGNMKRIRDSKQYVVRLGLIAILAAVCTLVPSASGQTMPEALPAGASANVWFAGGEAIVETPQLEQIVPTTSLAPTPWGTPVQVTKKWNSDYNAGLAAGRHCNLICSRGGLFVWQQLDLLSTSHSHWQQQLLLHIQLFCCSPRTK